MITSEHLSGNDTSVAASSSSLFQESSIHEPPTLLQCYLGEISTRIGDLKRYDHYGPEVAQGAARLAQRMIADPSISLAKLDIPTLINIGR